MLTNSQCYWRLTQIITPEDFFRDAHRSIWSVIKAMANAGSEIDTLTVKEELVRRGQLEQVGGHAYVSALMDGVPDIANVEKYAQLVVRAAKLRRIIVIGNELMRGALDTPEDDPEDIASVAMAKLTNLATNEEARVQPLYDVVSTAYETLQRRRNGESVGSLSTGWMSLDLVKAIRRTFTIVGCPSGHGKTAFAVNVADRLAANTHRVAIFSLESTEEESALRWVSATSQIPHSRVQDWTQLRDDDLSKLAEAHMIAKRRTIWLTRRLRTIEEIYAESRRLVAMGGLDAIVIDYIQLIRTEQKIRDMEPRMSMVSQTLLEMAIDLEIGVIATSQVNKEHRQRDNGRLYMEDLKYAAAIGESSRVGLLFQRPWVYDKSNADLAPCLVRFQIEKNNENITNDVVMHFDDRTQRFSEGDCAANGCRRARVSNHEEEESPLFR